MADYIGITEAQSNPFAPLTSELVKQLRDNPIAIADGAPGAPKIQYDAIDEGLAQQPAGGLGTYVFGRQEDPTFRNIGSTLAGSAIRSSNAAGGVADTLSGTWRLMGTTSGPSFEGQTSLWLRIA